jgi:hypothetical protein
MEGDIALEGRGFETHQTTAKKLGSLEVLAKMKRQDEGEKIRIRNKR